MAEWKKCVANNSFVYKHTLITYNIPSVVYVHMSAYIDHIKIKVLVIFPLKMWICKRKGMHMKIVHIFIYT